MYEWIRAFHIILVIFWMAGLLYLPRLFVYHWTAKVGSELDKVLQTQEEKLLKIIMAPAMLGALVFGIWLIYLRRDVLSVSLWLYLKLFLVFCLFGYHGYLSSTRKKFAAGERPKTEKFFRMINEIPAILTIIIVLLAVLEPF